LWDNIATILTRALDFNPMPTFAANLSMNFNEVPFLDRFELAAQCGFRCVEFLFPYEFPAQEIKARLDRFGLKQVLFNLPPGDWQKGERGLAILPGREQDFADAVDKAAEYATALGCPQVHVMAGLLPAGANPKMHEEIYVANLRVAVQTLKARGVRALIEPLNTYDNPGYFLTSQAQARVIIDKVGSDNLFLQQDLYHCQIMEGNLAVKIKEYRDIARHYQIAGVPGRHEPDRGEVNWPYLFDLLDQLGYQGAIGCEYKPKGETRAGLGWAAQYGIHG
jgi:2-dehydrotetronate isomerase